MRVSLGSIASIVLLFVASAGAEHTISPDDVKGPYAWGSAKRVTHVSHLWLADQPDEVGFEAAKAAGVAVVINMRDPDEFDHDERAQVEALGMQYFNVPVDGRKFDKAAFEQIESIVESNEEAQILLHCTSSNRAGAWLAVHLVVKHGLSQEDALAVGRKAGITKSAIETSVSEYLAASAE